LLWYFQTKCNIAFVNALFNYYTNASTWCEILVMIGLVISEFKRAKNENLMIIVHLARWNSETDWNIKMLISAG